VNVDDFAAQRATRRVVPRATASSGRIAVAIASVRLDGHGRPPRRVRSS
jgi:hypothetical protein